MLTSCVILVTVLSLTAAATMQQVGKAFVFDYGEVVIGVRYLSDHKLAWEQVKGPEAGLMAEEEY